MRDGRFRRLLAAETVSGFGDTALYLMLGMWAKSLTGSDAAAGAIFFALGLPALAGPVLGSLVDRLPRLRLQIVTNALTACVVLTLLAVHSSGQLWILYLVSLCYGASFVITGSTNSGLLKDMLSGADLASANAILRTVGLGLRVLAPLAGAALFSLGGGAVVALIDVATFLVGIVLVAGIKVKESVPEPPAAESFVRRAAEGLNHIRNSRFLRRMMLAVITTSAVSGLIEPVIFAVIGDGLHRAPTFFGVLAAFQGAGAIAGGLAVTTLIKRWGHSRTVGMGIVLLTCGSLAFLSGTAAVVCAGAVADGLGLVWYLVAFQTALQLGTPARLQGRTTATSFMLTDIPQTGFVGLGSVLLGFVDYRALLLFMAVATACGAVVLLSGGTATIPTEDPEAEEPAGRSTAPGSARS